MCDKHISVLESPGEPSFDLFLAHAVCFECEQKWKAAKTNRVKILRWAGQCHWCEKLMQFGFTQRSDMFKAEWLCKDCAIEKNRAKRARTELADLVAGSWTEADDAAAGSTGSDAAAVAATVPDTQRSDASETPDAT